MKHSRLKSVKFRSMRDMPCSCPCEMGLNDVCWKEVAGSSEQRFLAHDWVDISDVYCLFPYAIVKNALRIADVEIPDVAGPNQYVGTLDESCWLYLTISGCKHANFAIFRHCFLPHDLRIV